MANRRNPRSQPWTNGRVTFAFHEDGCISLRRADSDDPASTFDPSQQSELSALFAEMVALGRSVRSNSLWLRSDKKSDDGRFVGISAEVTAEYKDKETGETVEYPYAYVPEQLEEFKPVAFAIKAKWNGYTLVPSLQAYAATDGLNGRSTTFTRTVGVKPQGQSQRAPQTPSNDEPTKPQYRRTNAR